MSQLFKVPDTRKETMPPCVINSEVIHTPQFRVRSAGHLPSMLSREERRARNEVIFRAGNEAITQNLRKPQDLLDLICECGSEECLETIQLTPAEYETVRSAGARFAIQSGHHDASEEVVLDAFERFTVIEKTGAGRVIAEGADPRA